ncbi:MAG: hypothetical protein P4L67_03070 [Candidatus Pacebacteria bacterium]|nr:hypothetical protein [Candidatus Paceibacterota bacterium]
MRRYVVFLVVLVMFLVFFVPTCSGQWSGNYSLDLKNRYFGTTVCGIFADEPVVQQDLDITRAFRGGRTALTVSIWNSNGFENAPDTFAYETDLDVNVTHKFGKYTVSAGDWIFFLTPVAGTNVNVISAKISRTITKGNNAFVPFAAIEHYDVTTLTSMGHGGNYPMIGTGWTGKLAKRFSIAAQAHANYDVNGGFNNGKGKALFYSEASLTFAVNESTTLTLPRFGVGGGIGDKGRPSKTVWGIGISKSF